MKNEIKKREPLSPAYILACAVFLILTLGPFIWAFIVSVTPEYEMFTNDSGMLP